MNAMAQKCCSCGKIALTVHWTDIENIFVLGVLQNPSWAYGCTMDALVGYNHK